MVEIDVSRQLATAARRGLRERVCVSAAIGAGLLGGAALLLFLLVPSVAIYDESPWRILAMVAATVRGEAVLAQPGITLSTLAVGAAMHFALALLYALALAGLVADVRRWLAPWIGLAFGVALYFGNIHGFTVLFPWFAELQTADTFIAHAFFGWLVARAYCELSPGLS